MRLVLAGLRQTARILLFALLILLARAGRGRVFALSVYRRLHGETENIGVAIGNSITPGVFLRIAATVDLASFSGIQPSMMNVESVFRNFASR